MEPESSFKILNLSITRICVGDSKYKPEDWVEDYRNKNLSLDDVMKDIEKGSKVTIKNWVS